MHVWLPSGSMVENGSSCIMERIEAGSSVACTRTVPTKPTMAAFVTTEIDAIPESIVFQLPMSSCRPMGV